MSGTPFTLTDLCDLLVEHLGLPERQRTDRPELGLSDLGLDSFDFAVLQVVLRERLGVELPDEIDREYTLGQIVGIVGGPAAPSLAPVRQRDSRRRQQAA